MQSSRILAVTCALAATALTLRTTGARASAPVTYDMTGHWTGTASAVSHGVPQTANIEGEFTASTDRTTFTGTFVVHAAPDENFTVAGKLSHSGKVVAKLTPTAGGRTTTFNGKLNTHTNTVSGTFTGHNVHGRFTLTKQ